MFGVTSMPKKGRQWTELRSPVKSARLLSHESDEHFHFTSDHCATQCQEFGTFKNSRWRFLLSRECGVLNRQASIDEPWTLPLFPAFSHAITHPLPLRSVGDGWGWVCIVGYNRRWQQVIYATTRVETPPLIADDDCHHDVIDILKTRGDNQWSAVSASVRVKNHNRPMKRKKPTRCMSVASRTQHRDDKLFRLKH